MTYQDQLLELFGQANPVPDPSVYMDGDDGVVRLGALEQWSEPMQVTNVSSNEQNQKEHKGGRRWIIGIAAVLVVVLGVGAALAIYRQSSDASSPEITAIHAAYDALNGGDIRTYTDAFTGEGRQMQQGLRQVFEADLVADAHYRIEDCVHEGVDANGLSLVSCDVTISDKLIATAGLEDHGRSVFHVGEDLKIEWWEDNLSLEDSLEFVDSYLAWMREAHENEYYGMYLIRNDWWSRTPESMEVALRYVDEFVAQSDIYPVEP